MENSKLNYTNPPLNMNFIFQDYIKVKSRNSNMLEKSYNVGHKEKWIKYMYIFNILQRKEKRFE